MNKKTLAIALLFALLISAIPITSVNAVTVPNPDTITVATAGNAATIDPAWCYDTASAELIFNVYETLLFFENESVDRFVPRIAKSWPGSTQDGKKIVPSPPDPAAPVGTVETWYFKIDTSIPWQNPLYGTVETGDVEFSIERGMVQDPTGGPQWMFFEPLLSAYSSRDWNLADDGVAAQVGHMIDDAVQHNATHVWFNLKQGYAAFQQILTQSWGSILNYQWVQADGEDWPGFNVTGYVNWRDYNDLPEPGPLMDEISLDPNYDAMMGTGPYMLDYWDVDPVAGMWRIVKFNGYWRGWSPHPHATTIITKSISEWATRKSYFISEDPLNQVDIAYVPRANVNELNGEPGIRFKYDLPTLAGNAFFFNYDVDALSVRIPTLGGAPKANLFSDRHMRMAFAYAFNVTDFVASFYKGEAFAIGNPIIQGIAYYNASKPIRNINLAKVEAELKLAWGGQAWANGFTVEVNFNTGNTARKAIADMIAYVINSLKPGSVSVVAIPWTDYLTEMSSKKLVAWMLGWLADFPDPHNWVMPFMHTQGDFSGFQNINYGQDPASLDWKDNTYGRGPTNGFPYTNYAGPGHTVTELNNTYVNGLIEIGITIPDSNPLRGELYEELMDISYAEVSTEYTFQGKGRHYERDWLEGWYYNIIWPGNLYYELWKSPVETEIRDLGIIGSLSPDTGTLNIKVKNWDMIGKWEEFDLFIKIVIIRQYTETEAIQFEYFKYVTRWLAAGSTHTETIVLSDLAVSGTAGFKISIKVYVKISHWLRAQYLPPIWMSGDPIPDLALIPDTYPTYKKGTMTQAYPTNPGPWPTSLARQHTNYWPPYGDLGGAVSFVPTFFAFDGNVDGNDLALFIASFNGLGPY